MMELLVPVEDFNDALWSRFKEGKIRNVYPKAKYDNIIKKIKTMADNPPVNSPGEYYLLRKFVIAKVGIQERLACKDFNSGARNGFLDVNNVKFYVALEEIYEFIDEAHKSTNHGGRDRIARALQEQGVMNIARDTIELFLSFCQVCRPRQRESVRRNNVNRCQGDNSDDSMTIEESVAIKNPTDLLEKIGFISETKVEDVNANVNPFPNFRHGHVAILDLTASPDGNYRFILVYLDYQTQFTILRPVSCKCTYETASNLLDIFTLIGPPQILHSDYDSPFLSTVIQELKQSWPGCVIVLSRDTMNSDKARQCISDIEKMLRDWITENSSHRWSLGLRFIQMKKNCGILSGTAKCPFELLFGHSMPSLPSYLNSSLETEEDLINAVKRHGTQPEQLQVSLDPNICSLVQNNVPDSTLNTGVAIFEDELVIDTTVVKSEPLDLEEDS